MIEQALGPSFIQLVQKGGGQIVDFIDRSLTEMAVAGVFALRRQNLFFLVGENESAEEVAEKIGYWLRLLDLAATPVHHYPLPFQDPYVNCRTDAKKMEAKARLFSAWQTGRPAIIVSTLAALGVRGERKPAREKMGVEVNADAACRRAAFIQCLLDFGFQRTDYVENKGEMAWRGNVVDVYPLTVDFPLRLEFENDRVLSMRFFDLSSQRSVSPVSTIFIFSPNALSLPEARAGKELLPIWEIARPFCLVSRDFHRLQNELHQLLENFRRIGENLPHAKSLPPPEDIVANTWKQEDMIDILDFPQHPRTMLRLLPLAKTQKSLDAQDVADLKKQTAAGYRLNLFAADRQAADRLRQQIGTGSVYDFVIPLSFINEETQALFLTARAYHHVEKVEGLQALDGEKWLREMQPGEFVVHRLHGVGKFIGCKRLGIEGPVQEFLQVEYQGREFLYVPLYDLDALSRYKAFEGHFPDLDRMGGKTWRLKVYRAKRNIVHFARELLDLYAMRQSIKGYAYARQPDFEEKLEESFFYMETADQKKAIADTLTDLEKDVPMDRLLCGDVSFGKTEVAVRAAGRVVASQRQVAVLCPTTILAFQHHQTFQRRFRDLPVRVAMLSRLVPAGEKKEILRQVQSGGVDILIGTHAILSRAVTFKRLGLYIIDEEQRFGVFQKEKLKKACTDIDVLTLTATPIPRTLSLALSGLQDISLIRTPPLGRLSVQNFIGYYSRQVVVSAILSEVERDGQVFIIYNNIERIYSFRDKLQSWLPDIGVQVLHAQLDGRVIESSMLAFIEKKFRILLSTTIIENGIDIPAVNTLIVIDADRFGLTQLYQLRGRIGRSDRQAYAYFLVDAERREMSEKARKRLDAIREFSQLGAGYKIAEFDLQLRGAGSLLGNRQHGHIEALGFDYYLELIQQTVKTLKGAAQEKFQPHLAVHFSYTIDERYIENANSRLHVYRRILEAQASDDFFRIREELRDQYGRFPDSLDRLFFVGAAKFFAQAYRWPRIDVHADRLIIEPPGPTPAAARLGHSRFQILADGRVSLPYKDFAAFIRDCREWPKLFPG